MPRCTSTSYNSDLPLSTRLSITNLLGSLSSDDVGSTRAKWNTALVNIVNLRGFRVKVKLRMVGWPALPPTSLLSVREV